MPTATRCHDTLGCGAVGDTALTTPSVSVSEGAVGCLLQLLLLTSDMALTVGSGVVCHAKAFRPPTNSRPAAFSSAVSDCVRTASMASSFACCCATKVS